MDGSEDNKAEMEDEYSNFEDRLTRDKHCAVFPYIRGDDQFVYYLGGAPLLETFEAWNKVDVKMVKYKSIETNPVFFEHAFENLPEE